MTYDYYEEMNKQREQHTYRNQFGLIIDPNQVSLAYTSGNMDPDSIKKYEANEPKMVIINLMRKNEEPKKLGPSFDISDVLSNTKSSTSGTLLDTNDISNLLKKSRLK